MAGAMDGIAKSVELSPKMDALLNTTNLVYDGMLKIAQISFNGVIDSASRLASVMKEISGTALEVSMDTEVRMATITQTIKNKNDGMSDQDAAAAAGAYYQKVQDIRAKSLLEENDIYAGLRTMTDLGYKENDAVIQQVVDIASAKGKSMAEVANVFKLLKKGDSLRGMQAAIDLGLDKEELLSKNAYLKENFSGINNQNYTGSTDTLYEAILGEFAEDYSGMAEAQAGTLKGTWGTIKLRLEQIYLKAMGFDENGQLRAGTIFDKLQTISEKVSETLTDVANFKLPEGQSTGTFENVTLMFGALHDQLTKWYKTDGGKESLDLLAYEMGEGLAKMLMAVFGIKLSGEDQNIFVSIGKSIASSFWSGFTEEFDFGTFIQSALGKGAVIIGAGLLGNLLFGPGGGILAASLAGVAATIFDGNGTNPFLAFGLVQPGGMTVPNSASMDILQQFMDEPPAWSDWLAIGMASVAGLLLKVSGGKLFKGGLIPKVWEKYFKKETNYPKEILGKMGQIINPLDEIVTKLSGIAEQLNRIIECACDKCDCDNTKKGQVSKEKDRVKGKGTGGGGDLIDGQQERMSRKEKHKKKGLFNMFGKKKKSDSNLPGDAIDLDGDSLVDQQQKKVADAGGGKPKGKKWWSKLPGALKVVGIGAALFGGMNLMPDSASAATPDAMGALPETGSAIAEATSADGGLLSNLGSMLPDLGALAGAIGGGEAGSMLGAAIGTMIAPGIGTGIGGVVGGLLGSIVGGIFGEKAVVWMQGAIGSITGFLGQIGTLFANTWNSVISGVSTFGMNLWTGLTTWLGQTWTDAGLFLMNIAGSFGTWFQTAYNNAVQWIMGLPDAIGGFIAAIPGRISEFVEGVGAAFLNVGATIINSIRDGVASAYEKVSGLTRWVIEKAMNGLSILVSTVSGGDSEPAGKSAAGPIHGPFLAKQYHGGGLVENEGWAILKRKEMVLDENLSSFIRSSATAATGQTAPGSSGSPINIQIGALANTLQVREEADIHNIAAALSDELKRVLTNQGVYSQAEVAR